MKNRIKKVICLTTFLSLASIGSIAGRLFSENNTHLTESGNEEIINGKRLISSVPDNTRNIDFNGGWKFILGDVSNENPLTVSYNDSHWRNVNLPHDYSIEQDYDPNVSGEIGHLPGGTGFYRKTFSLPETLKEKSIIVDFGGVYCESIVYINGIKLGEQKNGYAPFYYNLTPYLKFGENKLNVITVQVKNITDWNQATSRWYSGSGIYKDVTLIVQDKTHIKTDGVLIEVLNLKKSHTEDKQNYYADVDTTITLENFSENSDSVTVRTTLLDYKTKKPVEGVGQGIAENVTVGANSEINVKTSFKVNNPKLWDTKNPNLYYVQTEVLRDNTVVDIKLDRTGFRYFDMYSKADVDAGKADAVGFYLNGEFTLFEGVCMHHDQGALGAAQYDDAIFRQMQVMKDMGTNAIRITHNFADEAILRACDEMGLLAIEESFDMWTQSKGNYGNAYYNWFSRPAENPNAKEGQTWAEWNLKTAFTRSHNYPSIVMYSIGNEIPDSKGDGGLQTTQNLVKWTHEVDVTPNDNTREHGQRRIVTIGQDGFSSGGNKEVMHAVESQGNNYNRSVGGHEQYLDSWLYYGSETSSAVKSRGYYKYGDQDNGYSYIDGFDGQLSSFDNSSVPWGYSASKSFRIQQYGKNNSGDGQPRALYPAGEFVWTGFDYIGEPTPWNQRQGRSPTKSYFGIVDTAGFAKDDYFLYQSQWLDFEEKPIAHIVGHNSWTDQNLLNQFKKSNGKYPLRVYTNAPQAEMFVQEPGQEARSLGKKSFQNWEYVNHNITKQYQRNPDDINKFYLEWELDTEYTYKPGTKYFVKIYDKQGQEVEPVQDFVNPSNVEQVIAGEATNLELKVENTVIDNDGYALSYIEVQTRDSEGRYVPTSMDLVNFEIISGGESAEIIGVDNGDSVTWERHKDYNGDWRRSLFNGRALVIVKSKTKEGVVHLQATANGLKGDVATVYVTDTDSTPVSSNQVTPLQESVEQIQAVTNKSKIEANLKIEDKEQN